MLFLNLDQELKMSKSVIAKILEILMFRNVEAIHIFNILEMCYSTHRESEISETFKISKF